MSTRSTVPLAQRPLTPPRPSSLLVIQNAFESKKALWLLAAARLSIAAGMFLVLLRANVDLEWFCMRLSYRGVTRGVIHNKTQYPRYLDGMSSAPLPNMCLEPGFSAGLGSRSFARRPSVYFSLFLQGSAVHLPACPDHSSSNA